MVVGSIIQGIFGNEAADAQSDAISQGNALQQIQFEKGLELIQPQITAGNQARDAQMFEVGLADKPEGYGGFSKSPSYDFVRSEGLRGIERSAAARGMSQSGAALKALNKFNNNLASQEYNTHYNRLASLAGHGQTASAQGAGMSNQLGGNLAAGYSAMGDARASGIANWGNAIGNDYQDAKNAAFKMFGAGGF